MESLSVNSYEDIPLYTLDLNENSGFPFWIGKNRFRQNSQLHQHQYIQINYVVKGRGYHIVNNTPHEIEVGDIFVMPPFVPHKILSSEKSAAVEVMEIEFVPEFINEQFNNISQVRGLFDFSYIASFIVCVDEIRSNIRLSAQDQQEVNRIIQHLYQEYQLQRPLFEHAFKALLMQLLVIVNRSFSELPENSQYIQLYAKHRNTIENVVSHIEECYMEDLKVEDMARLAMMSQSYFCYFFKLLVGKTFTQYLIEVRLKYAKQALQQSDASITEVATNCGFNNVSHFIRTFKANVNLSPTQYRKVSKG